ncbi:MAG: AsnC family transcriptional regulator, partial [Longimicrobiales bacterium]|nr:AsnC family transcriptional regulator [Longimicrobiales bacterium]
MSLDATDRELLNLLQTDFPLVERPYAVVGERLGLSEAEVIDRVGRLRSDGLIREISAIFDSGRLGYQSVLVALEVVPARLAEVGPIVSAQPGVSHNYARDHRYNLWFTLTVPPGEGPAERARGIQAEVGVQRALVLPALRRFKIGVNFDVREWGESGPPSYQHGGSQASQSVASDAQGAASRRGQHPRPGRDSADDESRQPGIRVIRSPNPLTAPEAEVATEPLADFDRALVRELQLDLPLVPRPFLGAATRLGITEAELVDLARRLQARGLMRRFAAVLRHRAMGFVANGMTCWVVAPERVEEVGRAMADWPGITHCYERPTYPDWPYNLFGML